MSHLAERIKSIPRRTDGKRRKKGWYRARKLASTWVYFNWDQPMAGLDKFTQTMVAGKTYDLEFIGNKPDHLGDVAFEWFSGVACYWEKS